MLDYNKLALPPGNQNLGFEKSLLDIDDSALHELDSLLSSTSSLEDSALAPFTSLLCDPQLSLAGDMPLDDSTSEVSSDTDSGYQESPPAWVDDGSLESWLVNSVSSAHMSQALPPIDSIIATSQPKVMVSTESMVTSVTPQSLLLDNTNVEFQQNAADLMMLTPPPTPCMTGPVEPVQIKSEPLDTCMDLHDLHATAASPLTVQNVLAATSAAAQQHPGLVEPLQGAQSAVKMDGASAEELFRLKFSPHVLPPCRVCGAQATGYHYGANTCEPCKGFYHRMTKRMDKNLVCLKQNNCVITSKNRGACPACRFQKCVKAGMCKNNIKTGRYSYSKRSRDIIELQNSISQRQQQQQQQQDAYELALAHSALAQSVTTSTRQLAQQETVPETDVTSQCILTTLKAARDKIMGKILQARCELSQDQRTAIHDFSQHLENGQRSLAYESFLQWINLGFKHNYWSSFVKAIPGFKRLPMQDQIAIIKKCFMDFWAVSRHRLFDVDNSVFYGMGGLVIPLTHILDEEQNRRLMRAVKRLQNLSLSVDECCALSAFVAVNTESSCMTEAAGVEEIKMQLLNTLMYTLQQNRPRPLSAYSHIISALTELKGAFHSIPRDMARFPESVTPPLFREILLANLDS